MTRISRWRAIIAMALVSGLMAAIASCALIDRIGFKGVVDESKHSSDGAQIASILSGFESQNIAFDKVTHFLVVGYSDGLGNQFFEAAVGRARRYQLVYPDHQIVILRNRETMTEADLNGVTSLGLQVLQADLQVVTGKSLLKLLDRFSALASLDFFAHSSAWGVGFELNDNNGRLSINSDNLTILRDNFIRDAYATINGCNNGLALAPALSKAWKIPVSGALTSTDFQRLHENGSWYFNNPGQAPGGDWASSNTLSFADGLRCSRGGCLRMKPDNHPYIGHWGKFGNSGLPFYKFFCNFEGGEEKCLRGMARSLYGFVSTRDLRNNALRDDFEGVVLDYLCPISNTSDVRERCIEGVRRAAESGSLVYNAFDGNPLECSFTKCQQQLICDKDENGYVVAGTCKLEAPNNENPTTITREYLSFLKGFDLLNNPVQPEPQPSPTAEPTPTPVPIDTTEELLTIGVGGREGTGFEVKIRVQRTYREGEWIELKGKAWPAKEVGHIKITNNGAVVVVTNTNIISGIFNLRMRMPVGDYQDLRLELWGREMDMMLYDAPLQLKVIR